MQCTSLYQRQFPCRKCLPCRLNIAREKALRAIHEASQHEYNIFLTLTYNNENVPQKLEYAHFRAFIKSLRQHIARDFQKQVNNNPKLKNITMTEARKTAYLSYMVTGEYGDETKRPHWHAIIYNYRPRDTKQWRKSETGHQIYTSQTLSKIWNKGYIEYGNVTMDSAGYVARYSAKKLCHGQDGTHKYDPIHQTSTKRAMGKTWIEKYYKQTFAHGYCSLKDGTRTKIPRYYEDWFKQTHPDQYIEYYEGKKQEIIQKQQQKSRKEEINFISTIMNKQRKGVKCYLKRSNYFRSDPRQDVKLRILERKFKRLQDHLKL